MGVSILATLLLYHHSTGKEKQITYPLVYGSLNQEEPNLDLMEKTVYHSDPRLHDFDLTETLELSLLERQQQMHYLHRRKGVQRRHWQRLMIVPQQVL